MSMPHATLQNQPSLSPSQIADLRLAASKLTGPKRRAFEAEMTVKYCGGTPLMAEAIFGWGRQTVALGRKQLRRFVSLPRRMRNKTQRFAQA